MNLKFFRKARTVRGVLLLLVLGILPGKSAIAQVARQDSLALVALYNSTNGANWTDKTNWLSAAPVATWYGVTVQGNRVTELRLHADNLVGTLPAAIGNLTALTYLALFSNNISGAIPTTIGNLTSLTVLELDGNKLAGSIPAEIGNLANLAELRLDVNQLTGTLPAAIGNLTKLKKLNLFFNQLTGAIPPAIGNLASLTELNLSSNQFSGAIPKEIGRLDSLASLILFFNSFTGAIPAEIGDMLSLRYLNLSENLLSGAIPAQIGGPTLMTDLRLDSNILSGPIPAEIGNLTYLGDLRLNNNQLTGAVPNSFKNLMGLFSLQIQNNLLTDLPDLSSISELYVLEIQNNKFTFEDIEPNIGLPQFVYAPQDSVGIAQDLITATGASITLAVDVGGANNQYQWRKNSVAIPFATSNSYTVIQADSGRDAGIYICEITNTVATALTLTSRPITVRVVGNALSVTYTPATANNAVTVTATLNVDFQPTTSQLFYRRAGELDFQATTLNQTGNQFSGTIPADFITARGTEYYVSLSDAQTEFTFPEIYPYYYPAVLQVHFGQLAYPLALHPEVYKMISVPMELNASAIDSVLRDDYGQYDMLPRQWRIFRWQYGSYSEHLNIEAQFTLGNAFWLITREGKSFNVGRGQSVNSAEPVAVTLQPGWNQIANPFAFPVDWSYVDAGGSVQAPVFYDGTQYLFDRTILEPWEGYFVLNQNTVPVQIFITPLVSSRAAPKTTSRFNFTDKDIVLKIAAAIPGTKMIDGENYLGLRENASTGRDALDFYEPPPIGEFLRLIISEDGREFAGNFKPLSEQGQQWEVQITSSRREPEVQIQLHEMTQLPGNFRIYILDQDRLEPVPVSNNFFTVKISKAFPVRRLKILVGTQEFAEQSAGNIALAPMAYALYQNYPNPFGSEAASRLAGNSEAVIKYQISKPGRVKLEIFNLMGQKIRTLVDEERNPGLHAAQWEGLDEAGRAVASGVYFYRLTAGEFTATRKLVLSR